MRASTNTTVDTGGERKITVATASPGTGEVEIVLQNGAEYVAIWDLTPEAARVLGYALDAAALVAESEA